MNIKINEEPTKEEGGPLGHEVSTAEYWNKDEFYYQRML